LGYDLHITRATDWTDSETTPIALAEWHAYLRTDPEMRLDGHAEASTPSGEQIRIESAGLAVWTAHENDTVWFDHRRGRIVVKNPDEPTIAKMIGIAQSLGARVLGDDGELYK
jgi:hypothetical protein